MAIHCPVTCLTRKASCSGGAVQITEAFERVTRIPHEAKWRTFGSQASLLYDLTMSTSAKTTEHSLNDDASGPP
jgi:hypothetical protein